MAGKNENQNILKHPLFLLLIGTIISSIIIPAIASHFSYKNKLQRIRLELSSNLIEKDGAIKIAINNLKSTLEIFVDDYCMFHDSINLRSAQNELRLDMNRKYEKFEEVAWFWHAKYNLKAQELNFDSIATETLSELLGSYNVNVEETSKSLDTLWNVCLKKSFACDLPELEPIKKYLRQEIDQKNNERATIILELIQLIAEVKMNSNAFIY